jgi:hypothetical protein
MFMVFVFSRHRGTGSSVYQEQEEVCTGDICN